MVYSRPIPVPQKQGTLVHHVSDTHIGYRSWSYAEMDHMLMDLQYGLMPQPDVLVHTGDVIDDSLNGARPVAEQDSYAVGFLPKLIGTLPSVVAPGNHDMVDHTTRSAWEAVYGRPGNSYVDVGPYRFAGFCPDTFTSDTSWVISDATWSWLDSVCQTSQSVILCDHYPPYELGEGLGGSLQPPANLDALVAGYPNVVGMLCGHEHFPIEDGRSTQFLTIGGRPLPVITDNSAVFTEPLGRDQLGRLQAISTFIDLTPEAWRVHYRLHGTRAWSGPQGLRVTTMDLAAGTVTHSM